MDNQKDVMFLDDVVAKASLAGSKTLIRIASLRHADEGAATDSLAGVRSIPGFVFGYVDEKECRVISFHEDTAPTDPLPTAKGMSRVIASLPVSF